MKRRLITGVIVGVLAAQAGPATSQARDPTPAAMLTESYFDNKRKTDQNTASLLSVSKAEFASAYARAGKPKLVFLLGQPFSGLVSDWHSQHRLAISASSTNNEHTRIPDTLDLSAAHEYRRETSIQRSALLTAGQWSSYERAFRGTLLEHGVELIHRELALRLLDSEIRTNTRRNPQDDHQRLEMDMLRKHGKLLVEILPYHEERPKYENVGYNVALTSLENAVILADQRIAIPEARTRYRAENGGYALQRPRKSADYQPRAGGYQVLEEPLDIWAEQGTLAAQATLQLLYDRAF